LPNSTKLTDGILAILAPNYVWQIRLLTILHLIWLLATY